MSERYVPLQETSPYPPRRRFNKAERQARKNLAAFLHLLEPPAQPLRTFTADELFDAAAFPAGTIIFFKLREKSGHHAALSYRETMHWGVVEKYKDEEAEKSVILSYFINPYQNRATPDYPFGKFEGGNLQVGEVTHRRCRVTTLQLYHVGQKEEHTTLVEKVRGLLHPVGLHKVIVRPPHP